MLGLGSTTGVAWGQSKAAPAKAKPAAKAPATKAPAKAAPAAKAKKAKPAEPESAKEPAEAAAEVSDESSKPTTEGETKVKAAAATDAATAKAATAKEKEGPEGVKTYQFGAIEVEGRLKSPQLIYFLRRVRAEFEAGALGHRSFLGELSDTRNESTFR